VKIQAGQDAKCKVLCTKDYTKEEVEMFVDRIRDEYRVSWYNFTPETIPTSL
jgi:hypothetical protein